MELLSLLETDPTLRSFFNAYLANPIFPVSLMYDAKLECIVERAKLIAASRETVATWVTQERYACFRRSRLHIQYRLFEQLGGGALLAGDAHETLTCFKTFLGSSVGGALVTAWEELQFCKDSTKKAGLTAAKQRCLSALPIPLQPHKAGSSNTWIEVWEASALERLRSYWVPSYVMSRQRVAVEMTDGPSSPVSHMDPCHLALQEEGDMGQPLNHFLQRHGTGDESSALKVWEECLQFRNLEEMGCPFQTLEHSFSFLWVHIRTTGLPLIRDSSVTMEALWHAVKAGRWNEVSCMLDSVREQLFPILKRAWSNYVLEDCVSYRACFKVVLDDVIVPISRGHSHPITPFSGGRVLNKARLKAGILSNRLGGIKHAKVHKRIQPSLVSCSESSIPESPIEALGDMDTLSAFEQYLASNYDPLSQVCLSYQLWRSILSCRKLPSTEKAAQNRLASQIYRTYLRHDSVKRVELPEHAVAQIPCYVTHCTPNLSTLRTIQMAAGDMFAPAIPEFLQKDEDDDLCPSLPALEASTNNLKDKTLKQQSPLPTVEEVKELTAVLELSGRPSSQQLEDFTNFLHTPAAPTGITNLLYFWLEAHRFKRMFKEGLQVNTLWCKAEALLSKFLDATCLELAVPSSLIQQLQRAGEELRKFRSPQGFECFCEVLTQIQDKAFGEMLPHWRGFCRHPRPQQNAATSKVTLPKITSKCPLGRKVVTTTTSSTTGRTSLLTYSELKGIEWKAPIDL